MRPMLKRGLLFASTMALLGPCAAQNTFQIGVDLHVTGPNFSLQATQAPLVEQGLSFRSDVFWSDLEAKKGILRWPVSYGNLDNLVNLSVDAHRRPLLILDYGNQYYDGGKQVVSQEAINAYVRYALFVVDHYKGRVDQFEVWNEWNIGTGTNGTPGTAVAYANLLRATYTAIKANYPSVTVVGGVIGVGGKDAVWAQQFVAAGGLNYLDAFSVHPYVHCNGGITGLPRSSGNVSTSSLEIMSWLLAALPTAQASGINGTISGTPEESMAWVDSLNSEFSSAAPARVVPVYISEMGWPTSRGQCGIAEWAAAAYLQRLYLIARSRPWIAGVWWYDLFDDGDDPSLREHRFGLLNAIGSAKPAYLSLSLLGGLLNSTSVSLTVGSGGEQLVAGRTSSGKLWYAAWIPTNDFSVRRPWGLGAQLLVDGYKSMVPLAAVGSLSIGAVPVILIQK